MESDINNEIPKSTFMYSLMYTWPNKAYRLYFVNWSIKRLKKKLTSKPDQILTKLFVSISFRIIIHWFMWDNKGKTLLQH